MAEREARVLALSAGRLRLELLGSACDGCAGGCGGRCSVFAGDAPAVFEMDVPQSGRFVAGQPVRLRLDDAALRRAAWRGYGWVLLGLMAGAAAGQLVGRAFELAPDLLTLFGLLLGTFLAAAISKPRLPQPELLPAAYPHEPNTRGNP
jgi:hypothetical protein